jgi:hypothetical protein
MNLAGSSPSRPLTMLRPMIASVWTTADELAMLASQCTACQ